MSALIATVIDKLDRYTYRLSLTLKFHRRLLLFQKSLGMTSQAVLRDVQDHLAKVRSDPTLPLDSKLLEQVDGYITGMQQVECTF